jgi:hypothetical protein
VVGPTDIATWLSWVEHNGSSKLAGQSARCPGDDPPLVGAVEAHTAGGVGAVAESASSASGLLDLSVAARDAGVGDAGGDEGVVRTRSLTELDTIPQKTVHVYSAR